MSLFDHFLSARQSRALAKRLADMITWEVDPQDEGVIFRVKWQGHEIVKGLIPAEVIARYK